MKLNMYLKFSLLQKCEKWRLNSLNLAESVAGIISSMLLSAVLWWHWLKLLRRTYSFSCITGIQWYNLCAFRSRIHSRTVLCSILFIYFISNAIKIHYSTHGINMGTQTLDVFIPYLLTLLLISPLVNSPPDSNIISSYIYKRRSV